MAIERNTDWEEAENSEAMNFGETMPGSPADPELDEELQEQFADDNANAGESIPAEDANAAFGEQIPGRGYETGDDFEAYEKASEDLEED